MKTVDDDQWRGAGQGRDTPRAGAVRIVRSGDLFQNAKEIIIDHDGDHYRLRSTSKGKLILTK